ncbi:hypothetical protein [Paenibacillus germinis]|uniref:hypothetical protein n=1 Tax=Paenibacillus germinis TaxID=2654979 RepID=UPI001491B127|nr:hypothetical protein [Paenibacillus germinis]
MGDKQGTSKKNWYSSSSFLCRTGQQKLLLCKSREVDAGYFYCTIEDMECSATLSRHQQEKAVKSLVELGLIRKLLKGQPATRHFFINYDERILKSILDDSVRLGNNHVIDEELF